MSPSTTVTTVSKMTSSSFRALLMSVSFRPRWRLNFWIFREDQNGEPNNHCDRNENEDGR